MKGSDYRKIYKDYYECIPTDETGRTFDIHHIDGNRNNNNINNLKAVNITKAIKNGKASAWPRMETI